MFHAFIHLSEFHWNWAFQCSYFQNQSIYIFLVNHYSPKNAQFVRIVSFENSGNMILIELEWDGFENAIGPTHRQMQSAPALRNYETCNCGWVYSVLMCSTHTRKQYQRQQLITVSFVMCCVVHTHHSKIRMACYYDPVFTWRLDWLQLRLWMVGEAFSWFQFALIVHVTFWLVVQ